MSRDINDIMKDVMKSNKEIHSMDKNISKDIDILQKSVKSIEYKLSRMDATLEKLLEILNNITIFVEDVEDNQEELDDEEDWTPYDERNFNYEDEDDEDVEDDWNSHEDES